MTKVLIKETISSCIEKKISFGSKRSKCAGTRMLKNFFIKNLNFYEIFIWKFHLWNTEKKLFNLRETSHVALLLSWSKKVVTMQHTVNRWSFSFMVNIFQYFKKRCCCFQVKHENIIFVYKYQIKNHKSSAHSLPIWSQDNWTASLSRRLEKITDWEIWSILIWDRAYVLRSQKQN